MRHPEGDSQSDVPPLSVWAPRKHQKLDGRNSCGYAELSLALFRNNGVGCQNRTIYNLIFLM